MMTPTNEHESLLDRDEQHNLREAIQHAVLGAEGLNEDLENSTEAYLHLVARADLAVGETTQLLADAVNQARRMGHSWAVIGRELGISRQAAQQRFGSVEMTSAEPGTRRIIEGATAFNEMEMLKVEGERGYHLVSFGPLYLDVEASTQRWEHMRITAVVMGSLRSQLEQSGWQYVGSWFPFRYFKRRLGVPVGGGAPGDSSA